MGNRFFHKIGALALALVLSIGAATTASASEVNEMQNEADATVEYNVSGTFTILVPEYIDVTYGNSLYATEMNLAPDYYVSVNLANIPEGGVYTLNHTSSDDSIDITFSGDYGAVTPTQPKLAIFEPDSENSSFFFTTMTEDSASTTHKAGAYRGTVRFNFLLSLKMSY